MRKHFCEEEAVLIGPKKPVRITGELTMIIPMIHFLVGLNIILF